VQNLARPRDVEKPPVDIRNEPLLDPDGIEKDRVMADDDQCAVVTGQGRFEQFDRLDVEMVGRLIEQQQVGWPRSASAPAPAVSAHPAE